VFTGAPVLFIPGNAGIGHQARSIGSVTFMKSAAMAKLTGKEPPGLCTSHTNYGSLNQLTHTLQNLVLNVFAVDFDEQLCALSGELLQRQTDYTLHAIDAIFNIYKNRYITNVKLVLCALISVFYY
jgi:hypothetical protein